jgi:predicted transposase YdaD
MFDALVENAHERRRLAREEGIRQGNQSGMDKGIRLGMDEGRDEGRREEALEIARQMKEDGFTPEQIRKYTGVADPG